MSNSKHILLITICTLTMSLLIAQKNAEYNPLLSKTAAMKDIKVLQTVLYETHPAPFAFVLKDSLDYFFEQAYNLLPDSIDEKNLYVVIRKLLHHIGCGHSYVLPSKPFTDSLKTQRKILPAIKVALLHNKLFITKNESKDSSIVIGSELVSINEISSEKMIADMLAILNGDGFNTSGPNYKLADNFITLYYFLYGISANYKLLLKKPDGTLSTCITAEKKLEKATSMAVVANNFDTISSYKTLYLLKDTTINDMVVMRIGSFGTGKQQAFYKKAFNYLAANNIKKLAIDLRGNGGGNIIAATKFLRFMIAEKFKVQFGNEKKLTMKKYLDGSVKIGIIRSLFSLIPTKFAADGQAYYTKTIPPIAKNHFNGNIFVLTDGATFSAASYVAAILKHHAKAVIVGQQTGGGETSSNGMLQLKYTLPESKLRFSFQYYHFLHDIASPNKSNGIQPDYEVQSTKEGLGNDEDIVWQALKKIVLVQQH